MSQVTLFHLPQIGRRGQTNPAAWLAASTLLFVFETGSLSVFAPVICVVVPQCSSTALLYTAEEDCTTEQQDFWTLSFFNSDNYQRIQGNSMNAKVVFFLV